MHICMMSKPSQIQPSANEFDVAGWHVNASLCSISKDKTVTKIEPKVMDLLVYFAQRPNSVLSREELEREIWHGTIVGYDALSNAIIKLRKAFNDDARHPQVIETVAKRGYRLIASVHTDISEHRSDLPELLSNKLRHDQFIIIFLQQ